MARPTNPKRKARYHEIDGWRGYRIPPGAVAGSSDTGEWSDSPCPSGKVTAELKRLMKYLRSNSLHPRSRSTPSSNCFMVKRWIIVPAAEFDRAAKLTLAWLEDHNDDTHYVHDADLEDLGFGVKFDSTGTV